MNSAGSCTHLQVDELNCGAIFAIRVCRPPISVSKGVIGQYGNIFKS
jgi:hypothetical protein